MPTIRASWWPRLSGLQRTQKKWLGIKPSAGRRGSLMAPQTRKSSARAPMKFFSLISFLAKSVMIPFSIPALSECPAALFHVCISRSLEKQSMICALLNKAPPRVALASGVCQKPDVLGFQPASNTEQMVAEIGPVAWFQRRGGLLPKWDPFSSRPHEFCALCRH